MSDDKLGEFLRTLVSDLRQEGGETRKLLRETAGQVAYEAYCRKTNYGVSWEHLTQEHRDLWEAVAYAVLEEWK